MFITTPRKRGDVTTFNSPNKVVSLRGLFSDRGLALPRLPAPRFVVRKEGHNKGRSFYTCQQPKGSGCEFFLWADDAAGREMKAVIGNSRSEVDFDSAPTDKNAFEKRTKKREGNLVTDDDGFGEWPLSSEDEKKIVAVAERQSLPEYPETPRKAIKAERFTTPGSKRKLDEIEAWPTPITGKLDDAFTTPSTTRWKEGRWDRNEPFGLHSPSITPTPGRFHDAIAVPNRVEDHDITEEAMELMKDQSIDDDTSSNLRKLLNKYALWTSGITRGRDIVRVALKARELKIGELQQRIAALEREREMDKAVIKHFKSDIAQSIATKRGRSRGRGR